MKFMDKRSQDFNYIHSENNVWLSVWDEKKWVKWPIFLCACMNSVMI